MPTVGDPKRGAIAGAVLMAVARFVVALVFLNYVGRYGGQWWSGAQDMWLGALVSALIGLPIGALAGWTCRPAWGMAIGAALSGGACLALFVVPAELMIGMSHPGGYDRIEAIVVVYGFAGMILAGAIAGGAGAAIGRRAGAAKSEAGAE